MNRACALPECRRRIVVGQPPYVLAGHPEHEYCSRECCGTAWERWKKGKPKSSYVRSEDGGSEQGENMEVPAEDFGDAGIVREFCDRSGCQNIVTLRWTGRYGIYCSNACMKLAEETAEVGESEMTEETATATEAPAAEKPITAGKTSTAPKKNAAAKKATAKASAKKAPAAKAAKPAKAAKAKAPSNGSLSKDKTIKVLKTEHEFRGDRAERMNILLKCDGKTVQDFREALSKKKLGGPEYGDYVGSSLRHAIEAGLVSVK